MSSAIIQVENLSKRFVINHQSGEHYTALRDVMVRRAKKMFSFPKTISSNTNADKEEFWALNDVSFDIQEGDRVGIIGRNGAGKSTLLKILSRITEPTKGRIRIKGRVASLLEVGTGFHPELTGRENIFLNGAILGMSRREIQSKFDEIVAFAEVEKFLDTPVKRYSSGMYVRLAFAVAAHLEPEILVVDEVLAVGDAQFQRKCLSKMEDVSANSGRTVLFVSHNMEAVKSLCNKGILLHQGKILFNGDKSEAISHYLNSGMHQLTHQKWDVNNAPGNESVKLVSAAVLNVNGADTAIDISEPFYVEFEILLLQDGTNNIDITIHLIDEMNNLVLVSSTSADHDLSFTVGSIKVKCRLSDNLFHPGTYTISRFLIVKDRGHVLYEYKNILTFELTDKTPGKTGWKGKEGVIKPKFTWNFIENDTAI